MFRKLTSTKRIHTLTKSAAILAFVVIVLGAYTRLTDSGLGCPDWPGCYGNLVVASGTIDAAKAWIEMIHRYVAGSLGLFILMISVLTFFNRPFSPSFFISLAIVFIVVFQAMLGMWTVTLKLYPIVVCAHLLGGMTILSLLWLLKLSLQQKRDLFSNFSNTSKTLKFIAVMTLLALVAQIALGGWTSANYAALACPDFPTCQGKYLHQLDFKNAFDFFNIGIMDSPGEPLQNQARLTIHLLHRLGAIVVAILGLILGIKLMKDNSDILRDYGVVLIILLSLQILLGISNIMFHLPLWVAVSHNAIGALLLITLLTVNYQLNVKRTNYQ